MPEWKIGQTNFLAYDDSGFALAAGTFDKGKEGVAEWLMSQEEIAVSHGMPVAKIKRDPADPSIIIEHETIEISPLPAFAAANKHTGFIVLDSTKEADMAIPEAKRKTLIERWNMSPAQLEALEKMNQAERERALEEGRDSKESSLNPVVSEPEAAIPAESLAVEAAPQAQAEPVSEPTQDVGDYPTRTEIADAFGNILGEMRNQIDTLNTIVDSLTKEITLIKEANERTQEALPRLASVVPAASLASLLGQSVVGRKEAVVDERVALAKQKTKEAESASNAVTGIPFIDHMLGG